MSQTFYDNYKNLPAQSALPALFLRDAILPAVLGTETSEILYWVGKDVARKFAVKNPDDLPMFFTKFGLGNLQLLKQSTNRLNWELSGDVVTARLKNNPQADFNLEAGILAQQIEQQTAKIAESEVISTKKGSVEILTQLQPTDEVAPAEDYVEF